MTPHKKRFFLFSGLARCASCGFVMRGRTYKHDGKEDRHYIDTAHDHSVKCDQSWVLAKDLEDQIINFIREIRLPKPWVERIIQLAMTSEKSQQEEHKRLALRSRADRLQRLSIAGDLTESGYEHEIDTLSFLPYNCYKSCRQAIEKMIPMPKKRPPQFDLPVVRVPNILKNGQPAKCAIC